MAMGNPPFAAFAVVQGELRFVQGGLDPGEEVVAFAHVATKFPGTLPYPGLAPVWSSVSAPTEFFFTDSMPFRAAALVS